MVTVLVTPSYVRDSRRVVTVLVTAVSITSAIQASGGSLRRLAAGNDNRAFVTTLADWRAMDVEAARDSSGKTALHHAAWRGHRGNVAALIDLGVDLNAYSTGTHNFGKSAIFYAITRGRDDVVMLLLERGARVKIVNNKGQSVLSLAYSHCNESTIAAIEAAESREPLEYINFRKTHSDGELYGDLEPRFAEMSLGRPLTDSDEVTRLSVNPTTKQSRSGRIKRRNAAQDALRSTAAIRLTSSATSAPSDEEPQTADAAAAAAARLAAAAEDAAVAEASMGAAMDAALTPLRLLLIDAAKEPPPSTEAVVDAADAAVATLRSIQGSWLSAAAVRLTRSVVMSGAALNTRLLLSAAERPPTPAAGGANSGGASEADLAKRIGLLRGRLLRLMASPLRQLGASAAAADRHRFPTRVVPSVRLTWAGAAMGDDELDGPRSGLGAVELQRLALRPHEVLVWVDTAEGLRQASAALRGARYVGIDTEWTKARSGVLTTAAEAAAEAVEVAEAAEAVEVAVRGRDDFLKSSMLSTLQLAVDAQEGALCVPTATATTAGTGSTLAAASAPATRAFVIDALPRADDPEYEGALGEFLCWLLEGRATANPGNSLVDKVVDVKDLTAAQSGGTATMESAAAASTEPAAAPSAPVPQLVGFAFAGDAEILARRLEYSDTAAAATTAKVTGSNGDGRAKAIRRRVLDVQPTAVAFGVGSAGQYPSLRTTCEAFLGFTLGKEEQCSDWSRRPLSAAQLEYAALDALVCLRVRARQEQLLAETAACEAEA